MIVKPMGMSKNGKIDTYEIINWSTSAGSLIRWIKKHSQVKNLRKVNDQPLTDDIYVKFEYKGYPFSIESPFSDYWLKSESNKCPDEIFNELAEYLRKKKVNRLMQWFVEREYRKRDLKGI
jgi:hypothetical protein